MRYREQVQRTLPDLGPRGEGWVALQGLIFLAIFGAGWLAPAWTGEVRLASTALGALLVGAGGLLALRGVLDLGDSLTAVPRPTDRGHLVEHGVYAMVRHPIYSGLIMGAVGWGLATASPLAVGGGLVLGVFFDLKSRREEAWLAERYQAYPDYRRRTRKLIPWVY